MDNFSFNELLEYQSANCQLPAYKDEFETIKTLRSNESNKLRQIMAAAWLKTLDKKHSPDNASLLAATLRSNQLREQGNKFYTGKGDTRDVLAAARCYTEAIFEAPADTEILALAHANRAMALQEFGYYQQAYDDCLCALAEGRYPERLRHKVTMRQAVCAWRMKEEDKLEVHLKALKKTKLNDSYVKQLKELEEGLRELRETPKSKTMDQLDTQKNDKTKILESGEARDRCLIATQPIAAREVIFREQSSGFVPVGGWHICQHCATTLLIPFPCSSCHNVAYCSWQCRNQHVRIHRHECPGLRWQLLDQIGISQLAMRVVLEHLPETADALRDLKNGEAIWQALTDVKRNEEIKDLSYAPTLGMVQQFSCMSLGDICKFALVAELLVMYLREYTEFFEDLCKQSSTTSDIWEMITASLLLRHIGQFIVNAHTSISLLPAHMPGATPAQGVFLLDHTLWQSVLHPQRGRLHRFCHHLPVSAINLPYLSICNHACQPTFEARISGRQFECFAKGRIKEGEEIFNCYTVDYKHGLRHTRREHLKQIYHFECECTKCKQPRGDEEYLQYHRYRCSHPKCGQIFVPAIEELHWWWDNDEPECALKCPHCGKLQDLQWYGEFKSLLHRADVDACSRELLLAKFKQLDAFLCDFNELKKSLANEILDVFMTGGYVGATLSAGDSSRLLEVVKFYMKFIADQCSVDSIQYAAAITYLWDLMAYGKYKSSREEMDMMLKTINVLSDEYRVVFMNYYEDYIKEFI